MQWSAYMYSTFCARNFGLHVMEDLLSSSWTYHECTFLIIQNCILLCCNLWNCIFNNFNIHCTCIYVGVFNLHCFCVGFFSAVGGLWPAAVPQWNLLGFRAVHPWSEGGLWGVWVQVRINLLRMKPPNIYSQEEINLYCIIKLATYMSLFSSQISNTWCFV